MQINNVNNDETFIDRYVLFKNQNVADKNKMIIETPLHELVAQGIIPSSQLHKYSSAVRQYKFSKHLNESKGRNIQAFWITGEQELIDKYLEDIINNNVCYFKTKDKWFDGYNYEKVIIVQDVTKRDKLLCRFLKEWGESYSSIVEVRRGSVPAVWDRIYITSRFTLFDIFGRDTNKMESMNRIYKEISLELEY
jgi:hypothetical protein